ncbi:potassium channel family protein [Desulfolutivibrio sulfoxidireducens]|uniref:potassium channel family protein n=1 Tax=Desulfolutivibrio sulfoxidireducens TaxID=2773299 RepID=UPI00159E3E4C|nr:TrkA family potassium uptake protein [Desulfolutivibrio sulfoxidireducens]QLA14701.1 TrkA family potassium uptake protein [Desulfolutivibrio sulfoxidireducens]QLA18283.1 TrkA family potassium uptake protein [Desulfolutivibrio sulfoxidireducens]
MAVMQIGIIGLGKFGFHLGKNLVRLGHQVLGLDADPEKVRDAQALFTQVYQLEATDKKALEQIRVADMSHMVVSVGHSMEASILISLYLKELGVQKIWVKAVSTDHEKILRRIGVDEVFIPERYAAKQLAHRLVNPGLIEFLPMDQQVAIKELSVAAWAGKTLRQLDLTNTAGVQVIAYRLLGEKNYSYLPKADAPLRQGDFLVVVGNEKRLGELKP